MNTMHPTTNLDRTPSIYADIVHNFPPAHSSITVRALDKLTETTQAAHLSPTAIHHIARVHARAAWAELGGSHLMGWTFTVDGVDMWGELNEYFPGQYQLTLDLR